MKKNSIFIGIIFSLSILFASCKLDVKPENTVHRPDVEVQDDSILITGTYSSSDIQYINIYRKDITNNGSFENIGIIFPSGFNAANKTFSFTDKTYANGNKYVYSYRFYEGKFSYYHSGESDEVTAPASGSATVSITVDPALKLKYSDSVKEIALDGTDPSGLPSDYDFAMVISNGSKTQCFHLANYQWEAKDSSGTLVSTKAWNLQVLLPEDFLNTEIEVLGIVGQKKVLNGASAVQRIFWTSLYQIPVNNATNTILNNKFTVSIPTGTNGIDYGYSN